MDARHWTEDEFINRVYGVGGGDESHLHACGECRERWNQVEQRRSLITAEPEVSHEFLAAQRRAIYGRLDQRPARKFQWASALAATLMLLVGLLFFKPGQTPKTQPLTHSDDAVFTEVYSLEQSSEPVASKTMQVLFEEN